MGASVTLTTVADLPGQDIDTGAVSEQAKTLRGVGSSLEDATGDVVRTWQTLPASYASTGADAVYAAMIPVGTKGTSISTALGAVAKALDEYVSAVQPILAKIAALKQDILDFQSTTIPSYPKEGLGTGSAGGYAVADGATVQYDSWEDDPHAVETNHEHLVRAHSLTADLLEVQQTCATAIRAAAGLSAAGSEQVAAAEKALRATDFHWNAQVAVQNNAEGCAGSTSRALNGIFYDGVFIDGVVGTVQGLGGFIGWDGDHDWSWGQAGQSWLGLAHLLSGIGTLTNPIGIAEAAGMEAAPGTPDWLRDWNRDSVGAVLGLTGMVGISLPTTWWDPNAWAKNDYTAAWREDGWATLGSSGFNIVSLVAGGAGAVSKAGAVGRLAEGTRFADAAADGSLSALRGLSADELRASVRGLSAADAERLAAELAKPELDLRALSALKLDDLRIHLPEAPDSAPHPTERGDGSPNERPVEEPAPERLADEPAARQVDEPAQTAPHSTEHGADARPAEATPDASHAPADPAHAADDAGHAPSDPAHAADDAGHAPSDPAHAAGDVAQAPADPAERPQFTPRDHDYGTHTQPLKDPADRFDPGTTRSTKLGRIGEALTREDLAERGFKVVKEQLQIYIPDGGGKWFKPDFLAVDPDGKLVLIESKMGEGARFTPGQLAGYGRFDAGDLEFKPVSAKIGPQVLKALRDLGVEGRVIDRVEVYRWNVDVVPDSELVKIVPTVR